MKVIQESLIDIPLHSGDALVVDVDSAKHVRGGGTTWIEAPVLNTETDAGDAKLVDRLLLPRRDLALDVGKLGVGREDLSQTIAVPKSSVASSGSMT
jgi:hypothetical protein